MTSDTTAQIGLVSKLDGDLNSLFGDVAAIGVRTCHLSVYEPKYLDGDARQRLERGLAEAGVSVTGVWAGWPGRVVWDFVEGPLTTGLVPLATRTERAVGTKRMAELAAALGARMVMTHPGFAPEDPNDEVYRGLIPVLRDIARFCGGLGQDFCFETGQMTPVTMLRMIEDIGEDNVGINFDPANLLMYGKANPVDAVDLLGPHVRAVHIKDGAYPVNTRELGEERPLGEGQVDFPALLGKLRAIGYSGSFHIETEIHGPARRLALVAARNKLEGWLGG